MKRSILVSNACEMHLVINHTDRQTDRQTDRHVTMWLTRDATQVKPDDRLEMCLLILSVNKKKKIKTMKNLEELDVQMVSSCESLKQQEYVVALRNMQMLNEKFIIIIIITITVTNITVTIFKGSQEIWKKIIEKW